VALALGIVAGTSNYEKPVAAALRGKGFMILRCPKQEAVVDRVKYGSSALSGLLVLPLNLEERMPCSRHQVLYLVGVGKNPEAVDESELRDTSVMRSGLTVAPLAVFDGGSEGTMKHGAAARLEGVLTKMRISTECSSPSHC